MDIFDRQTEEIFIARAHPNRVGCVLNTTGQKVGLRDTKVSPIGMHVFK